MVPHFRELDRSNLVLSLALINDFGFVQQSTVSNPLNAADVNSPPAVPNGVAIQINSSELPPHTDATSDLLVYDKLTGQSIEFIETNFGIELTLPSFQHMLLVVVDTV